MLQRDNTVTTTISQQFSESDTVLTPVSDTDSSNSPDSRHYIIDDSPVEQRITVEDLFQSNLTIPDDERRMMQITVALSRHNFMFNAYEDYLEPDTSDYYVDDSEPSTPQEALENLDFTFENGQLRPVTYHDAHPTPFSSSESSYSFEYQHDTYDYESYSDSDYSLSESYAPRRVRRRVFSAHQPLAHADWSFRNLCIGGIDTLTPPRVPKLPQYKQTIRKLTIGYLLPIKKKWWARKAPRPFRSKDIFNISIPVIEHPPREKEPEEKVSYKSFFHKPQVEQERIDPQWLDSWNSLLLDLLVSEFEVYRMIAKSVKQF